MLGPSSANRLAAKGALARNNVTIVLRQTSWGRSVVVSVVAAATCSIVCRVTLDHRLHDIVMLYLLGVVVVAIRFGYAASLSTAVLSVMALDFLFIPPYFSLAVADKKYVVTFAIMLLVAFVVSNLMQRVRESAAAVREREVRTARLYAMSREVSIARTSDDIVRVACAHLRATFARDVAVLLKSVGDDLVPAGASSGPERQDDALSASTLATARALTDDATPSSMTRGEGGDDLVRLRGARGSLGVLVIRPNGHDLDDNAGNRELLDAYAGQIALAIERAQLAEDAQRAQVEVQRERLRNALLSSVSHDLRTPLAVMKGAVTALLEPGGVLSPERRHEYLQTISDEASRLNILVRNLLNMTSLEAGALRARKEWQPLEEVVGVALNRLDEQLQGRPVRVSIEPDANLAPFDATLIEQVLLNLIENAVRYTPPASPVEIGVRTVEGGVEIEVADRGPGVPAGQEEAIFEKFRRMDRQVPGGMGLGLTICRGIATVHGGRIRCEMREGGGAAFRMFLPRDAEVPELDRLPEAPGDA